jgi:hypothetical protein
MMMLDGNSPSSASENELRLTRELWQRRCRSDLMATEALQPYGEIPARHHAFLLRELEAGSCGETEAVAKAIAVQS